MPANRRGGKQIRYLHEVEHGKERRRELHRETPRTRIGQDNFEKSSRTHTSTGRRGSMHNSGKRAPPAQRRNTVGDQAIRSHTQETVSQANSNGQESRQRRGKRAAMRAYRHGDERDEQEHLCATRTTRFVQSLAEESKIVRLEHQSRHNAVRPDVNHEAKSRATARWESTAAKSQQAPNTACSQQATSTRPNTSVPLKCKRQGHEKHLTTPGCGCCTMEQ